MRPFTLAAASIMLLVSISPITHASDNKALDADILAVAEEWARIKYLSKDDSERKEKMEVCGAKADALVTRYPGRVEALIWDGIVTSERASLTWGLSALNHASRARDLLLQAYKMDPKALDAGAPTSLGVLYYRVPGFPLGWEIPIRRVNFLKRLSGTRPMDGTPTIFMQISSTSRATIERPKKS